MSGDPKLANLKYLLLPVIVLLFVLFTVSWDGSDNLDFVNVPCSSAVVIARDFGKSSLSSGQSTPERQSVYNLGQTAISNSGGQVPCLESRNIFSHDIALGLLRIQEEKVKYDLIISSNTGRSPPLSIS
jgi:hypothetical protein